MKYASLNIHNQQLPSKRDDIESIGYSLLYLVQKGNLQWDNDGSEALIKHRKAQLI